MNTATGVYSRGDLGVPYLQTLDYFGKACEGQTLAYQDHSLNLFIILPLVVWHFEWDKHEIG